MPTSKEIFNSIANKINELYSKKKNVVTVDDMIKFNDEVVETFGHIYDVIDKLENLLLSDIRFTFESYDTWKGITMSRGEEIIRGRLHDAARWVKYRLKVGDDDAVRKYAINWLGSYLRLTSDYNKVIAANFLKKLYEETKGMKI